MTRPRIHPRRALVAAGLLVALAAFVRDRDLLALPRLTRAFATDVTAPAAAVVGPLDRLQLAIAEHQRAAERFAQALRPWRERPDWRGLTGPEHPAWAPYWARRAEALPAYAASLERLAAVALELGGPEPGNGVFEVTAGLAEVERACSPGPVDVLVDWPRHEERLAAWTRVDDPQRLARGLALVDAGLARPRLSFEWSDLIPERVAGVEGAPIERLAARLERAYGPGVQGTMFVNRRIELLAQLARRERVVGGGGGEALLRRARRLALRHGAEGSSIADVVVGTARTADVDRAWALDAAARGDLARVDQAFLEAADLQRTYEGWDRLPPGLSLDRLGVVDLQTMPWGGWSREGFDPGLSRAMDHAVLESLVLLALLACGVLGLGFAWLRSRVAVPAGAPAAPGWTLGEALGVVLPSFVGVAVLALLHCRLHPARAHGIAGVMLDTFAQGFVFVALAAFAFCWLLRRAALGRHGLDFARPAWARAGLGLVLAGAHLALLWVGGAEDTLLLPGLVLVLLGALAGWRGGALGRAAPDPSTSRAVLAYEGRVGLASLGVALALVGALECALVAPRRDALVRAVDEQLFRNFTREAAVWRGGEPLARVRATLAQSPDAPAAPPP